MAAADSGLGPSQKPQTDMSVSDAWTTSLLRDMMTLYPRTYFQRSILTSRQDDNRTLKLATIFHDHIFSLPRDQVAGKPWAIIDAFDDLLHTSTQRLSLIYGAEKARISARRLADLQPKPKCVVEYGCFIGSSAMAWGAALKDIHGPDAAAHGARVWTFEMDAPVAQLARNLIDLAGLTDVVTVMVGPGAESLKKLVREGDIGEGEVDMVFMDHWKGFYLPDLKLCEELKVFHKGSVVMADNTDHPGAPDYLEYVKKGGSGEKGMVRYESTTIDTERKGGRGMPVRLHLLWLYLTLVLCKAANTRQKVIELTTVVEC